MMHRHPLRIGLTGGIGSGKSTVAQELAALGAAIVDTDAIARGLTQPGGAALSSIAAQFGAEYIDASGALDRARMRSHAFADPSARRRLEAILHPLIRVETARRADAAGTPVIVFDVPLLVESGRWREEVDKVLVIDCREAVQAERVMSRSGWTREAVEAVIAQQAPRRARRACADAVIFNDGIARAELTCEIRALWDLWCAGL
ncbi:dephospho-CoA kinase [uncultured Piscinibacter sp.]|uniref:dephospho-CoA kinase n=1 Tax=uncultured Piscinibacter sp. TaxID=1131835 RepID=UPI002620A5C9|nr:dephospho-CoA kinase [uncultured Piscinibacter sp.]